MTESACCLLRVHVRDAGVLPAVRRPRQELADVQRAPHLRQPRLQRRHPRARAVRHHTTAKPTPRLDSSLLITWSFLRGASQVGGREGGVV